MRAALTHWLLNVIFGALVALGYLQHAPEDLTPRGALFLGLALISSVALLSLTPLLLSTGMALMTTNPRRLARRQGLLWTSSLLLLFLDTRIYGVFRFHFNGVVWNSLVTPGSGDSIHLGFLDVLFPALGFLAVAWSQTLLHRLILNRALHYEQQRPPQAFRPVLLSILLLLPVVVTERNLYARDLEKGDTELATLSSLLPYYSFPQQIMKVLRGDPPTPGELVFDLKDRSLDYPKAAVRVDPQGARPNVLVLCLDGLRRDMLAPDTMPVTWAFAQDARVFENHWSGGNCTRHGVFTLMYGLHGSYWAPILRESRSPVMIDTMIELGYDPRILCSASQKFPEFRSTCWSGIEHAVEDEWEGPSWAKDRAVAARFDQWLDQRPDRSKPFFAFSLLDSTHANYSFPEDEAVFHPYADSLGYIRISYGLEEEDQRKLFNRYRNSVVHADRVVGMFLQSLRDRGLLENTVVVITGDHGEEFFENGYWGHHSNFSEAQATVPFVVRGPGVPPGVESRPTSHVDLVPTLLTLLGASPGQARNYSLGENLFDLPDGRRVVCSSWSSMAFPVPDQGVIVISAYSDDMPMRAYGPGWLPLDHEHQILSAESRTLAELVGECQEFLH